MPRLFYLLFLLSSISLINALSYSSALLSNSAHLRASDERPHQMTTQANTLWTFAATSSISDTNYTVTCSSSADVIQTSAGTLSYGKTIPLTGYSSTTVTCTSSSNSVPVSFFLGANNMYLVLLRYTADKTSTELLPFGLSTDTNAYVLLTNALYTVSPYITDITVCFAAQCDSSQTLVHSQGTTLGFYEFAVGIPYVLTSKIWYIHYMNSTGLTTPVTPIVFPSQSVPVGQTFFVVVDNIGSYFFSSTSAAPTTVGMWCIVKV